MSDNICLGDIVGTDSYGFPCFYKVVRMTEKTAVCRRIEHHSVADDGFGQNGSVMPNVPYTFMTDEPEVRLRINQSEDGEHLWNAKECLYLSKWDGRPLRYYTD